MAPPVHTKRFGALHSFDVLSNIDASIVARNVSSSAAALIVGLTADQVEGGVAGFSYVDNGDFRVTAHMAIQGGTISLYAIVEADKFTADVPEIGAPELAAS